MEVLEDLEQLLSSYLRGRKDVMEECWMAHTLSYIAGLKGMALSWVRTWDVV